MEVNDSVLDRALKELKISRHQGILNKMSRSKEFCIVLLWLVNRFKKQNVIHPTELAEFMVFSDSRSRQVLKNFTDLGFLLKRARGVIIEYVPIKNNDHLVLEDYVDHALRICEITTKTARLDEFKFKRGMK